MRNHTASPLSWPDGRPRKLPHERRSASFGTGFSNRKREFTINDAVVALEAELDRLRIRDFILSTNLRLRTDGLPISGQRMPDDPAAAVYFDLGGRETVIACDWWDKVQDNIYAIAKHIDALRGQDRWGCGTIEQAFAGYQALPSPEMVSKRHWRQVLGFPDAVADHEISREHVEQAFRELAKTAHPDGGGDQAELSELMQARDEARVAVA